MGRESRQSNLTQHVVPIKITSHKDEDTGGLSFSPKYAPSGWYQQVFELEFMTSRNNSIHEKDWTNNEIGWAELKFYDSNDDLITDLSDSNLDASCVRTDIEWMPDIDYMIKGGLIAQITTPNEGLYVWAQGVIGPFGPGGAEIIGSTFAEGGINMDYVNAREKVGLDGVSGTILYYDKLKTGIDEDGNPILTPITGGLGSNKIRFVIRHSTGKVHRLQVIFDLFRS